MVRVIVNVGFDGGVLRGDQLFGAPFGRSLVVIAGLNEIL